jgi:hypothetical protein
LDEVDRDIRALRPAEPTSRASVQTWVRRVKSELPRYEPIEEDALAVEEDAEDVDDEDVRRAADLLVQMIDHRHDGMARFISALERAPLRRQRLLLGLCALEDEETKRMNEAWEELAQLLSERYATI